MSDETYPILYTFRRCPFAIRSRMGLFESGRTVRLREVILRQKPDAMLEASPKGSVPVLVLPSGDVIDESLDIMLWGLEQSDPWGLLPRDTTNRAEMMVLINEIDGVNGTVDPEPGSFKFHLDRYKYSSRHDGAVAEDERAAAEPFLVTLEERLGTSSFLFGRDISIADLAIAPFIRQFAIADRSWFEAAPYSLLRAWLDKILARDAFNQVMNKYEQWKPGGEEPLLPVRQKDTQ